MTGEMMTNGDKLLTTEEAASIIGINSSNITRHIREGHLIAEKAPGGQWLILESDLRAFIEKHPQLGVRGRKKKGGKGDAEGLSDTTAGSETRGD